MGTMIQQFKLGEDDFRGERFASHGQPLQGDNEILTLTRPEIILSIHERFLEAGADILETNTFGATSIAQADYGLEPLARELNFAAARLARHAAESWSERTPDKPRFVAGAVGPTNKTLSLSPRVNEPAFRSVTFDEVRESYAEQVRGLIEGGVHLILVETIFDTLNAKAALVAIDEVFQEMGVRLPVMISVAITDASGRTLSGQTVDAFWNSIAHAKPLSVGVNCSLGAKEMRPYVAELSKVASTYVSSYPNAGLPNAFAEYDEEPSTTGALLREFAESGLVNFLGGCCGTTPDHIAKIHEATLGVAPRPLQPKQKSDTTYFSGLETLAIRPDANFMMIGERTNVTGSARFRKLIQAEDYETALEVALDQVRGGANILDVNMDEGMLDSEACMTTFLNLIATEPEVARIPNHDRQLQVVGHRSGPEVHPGQRHRELDLAEGRRGRLHREGPDHQALRRRRRRDGVRRNRPGRHDRAQGRDLRARVRDPHPEGGLSRRGHHLRPEHPRHRDGHRRARELCGQLHRSDAHHSGALPRRPREWRRVQPVVLVPRQQRDSRGDSLRVPLPRHPGRHGHGDRERGTTGDLRGHPQGPARARRGHPVQPARRRDRADGRVCRELQERRKEACRRPLVARERRRVTPRSRADQRHRRLHRRRHRGSAPEVRPAALGDRRAADGRHEDRRRPVRRREDVPSAGRQERARHEEGRRAPRAVHGEGKGGNRRRRRLGPPAGSHRHGDREG